MRCCVNCFIAKELIQTIEDQNEIDDCDYCGSEKILTAETSVLKPLFDPVLEYYEVVKYQIHYLAPDSDTLKLGRSLGFLLQDDWGIFSDDLDGSDKCNELIEAICDVEAHDLWCTLDDRWYVEPDANRDLWDKFSVYLKTKRRFLLKFDEAGIGELMDWLPGVLEMVEISLPRGSKLFRSRPGGKNDGFEIRPYTGADIGAPPPNPDNQSRGNPPGISYLYASSDGKTAVAEKRPARKSVLSLAELRTTKELSLVDLCSVPYLKSPFGVEFLSNELRTRRLLRVLGSELSRPVSTEDSPSEYLPSQFLCEFILDSGYDGVIYSSGYGPGKNYLIFDTKAAEPNKVMLVEVQDSNVFFDSGNVYDIREERLD